MTGPDLPFWTRLLTVIAVEAACVAGIAFLLEIATRAAFWRRAVWQGAVVCLLLVVASELSGFGRGVAAFWFGRRTVTPTISSEAATPVKGISTSVSWVVETSRPAALLPERVGHREARGPVLRGVWWPGLVWLGGLLLVLGRAGAACVLAAMLRRRRLKMNNAELRCRVAAMFDRLGSRRKVDLLRAQGLSCPIAFGILRPTIGLPADFAERFTAAEQEAMLAHELAHLAARDPLWYLLADVTSAFLWWHPPAWIARRRLQWASELAADEAAAMLPDGPATLAECLVKVGREMAGARRWGWIGVAADGRRSNLGERVERLLRMAGTDCEPVRGWRSKAAKVCATLLVSIAAICLCGCLENRDAARKQTLRGNLEQSWAASPASAVMRAALQPKPIAVSDRVSAGEATSATSRNGTREANGVATDGPVATNSVSAAAEELSTRVFVFGADIKGIAANLGVAIPYDPDHSAETANHFSDVIRRYLVKQGIDLTDVRKAIYFDDRTGSIIVRATSKDLDAVWQALEKLKALPRVRIDVKFAMLNGNLAAANTNGTASPRDMSPAESRSPVNIGLDKAIGTLNDQQLGAVLDAIETLRGGLLLSAPEVTTVSGRQAHLEAQEPASGSGTNEALPSPNLDVIPSIASDGYSIQMILVPTFTQPSGYDNPGKLLPPSQPAGSSSSGVPVTSAMPLPHYRVRPAGVMTVNVSDGQTIVLGGLKAGIRAKITDKVSVLGDLPVIGRFFKQDRSVNLPDMLLLITPRIVDAAGKPVHSDEELRSRASAGSQPRPAATPVSAANVSPVGTVSNAVSVKPNEVEVAALIRDGKLLYENGDYDAAEAKFKGALFMDASNTTAPYFLALIWEDRSTAESLPKDVAASGADSTNNSKEEAPILYTRRFHVGVATLLTILAGADQAPAVGTAIQRGGESGIAGWPIGREDSKSASTKSNYDALRRYMAKEGADIGGDGRYFYFNGRTGDILVHATLGDLDAVERALEKLRPPPQVQIDVKIAAVGGDVTGVFAGRSAYTNVATSRAKGGRISGGANVIAILNDEQVRTVLGAIENQRGADLLYAPTVTTLSGRQAHVAVSDVGNIISKYLPATPEAANAGDGGGAAGATNDVDANPLTAGPTLDALPSVSADGDSIQMVFIPSYMEFVGYHNPRGDLAPLPHFRVRQTVTQANLWDGQTMVVGMPVLGATNEMAKTDADLVGTAAVDRLLKAIAATNAPGKTLLFFVTPRLLDPAGNVLHTGGVDKGGGKVRLPQDK